MGKACWRRILRYGIQCGCDLGRHGVHLYRLSAGWALNQYTITYKGTFGLHNENAESYTVEEYVQLQPLEKYDYNFKGWRITNEDGQWEAIEEIPAGTIGNIVLTAEWELKPEFDGFSYVVDDNYFLPNGQNFCIFLGVDSKIENSITTLEIPTVFTHIQAGALKYCSQLEELTLPFLGSDYTGTAGSYLSYVFGAETALGQNDYIPPYIEAYLEIPRYSFETLHINGGKIGDYAFYQNLGIKHLIIDGVEVIRHRAFAYAESMETLTLHEGLIQIQDSAFMHCNNQKFNELIIPNSVTKLGGRDNVRMSNNGNVWYEGPAEASDFREGPFQFCGWLSKIVIGDGVEAVPSACFNRTNLPTSPELELTLGKNVRMIGPLAFYGTAPCEGNLAGGTDRTSMQSL